MKWFWSDYGSDYENEAHLIIMNIFIRNHQSSSTFFFFTDVDLVFCYLSTLTWFWHEEIGNIMLYKSLTKIDLYTDELIS